MKISLLAVAVLLLSQSLMGNSRDLLSSVQLLKNSVGRDKFDLLTRIIANINSTNDNRQTALHLVVQSGDFSAMESLLQLGADPHLTDGQNMTPFDYIEQQIQQSSQLTVVQMRIASMLLEKMNGIDGVDQGGWSPMLWAIAAGDIQRVEELFKAGAQVVLWGNNGVASLARQLQDKGILKIIETYLDPETTTAKDHLLLAIENNNQPQVKQLIARLTKDDAIDDAFLYSLSHGHQDAAILLSEHLSDINVILNGRGTPLHQAINADQLKLAHILLVKHGADPNVVAPSGYTPLMSAIMYGHFGFAHTLIDYGADASYFDSQDYWTFSALEEAIISGNLEITRRILELVGDINRQTSGRPPMATAATHGDIDMLKLLISYGGDVNAKNSINNFESCLHIVARRGEIEKAQLLLDYGADINATTKGYIDSPLTQATLKNLPNMVKFLLQRGADHRLVDLRGKTALDLAKLMVRRKEVLEIINLLEEAHNVSADVAPPPTEVALLAK